MRLAILYVVEFDSGNLHMHLITLCYNIILNYVYHINDTWKKNKIGNFGCFVIRLHNPLSFLETFTDL